MKPRSELIKPGLIGVAGGLLACETKRSIMDDSDQDFVALCSKLLKRVRKKPGGSRPPRKAEHQPSSQASDADKRREADSGSQPVCAGAEEHLVCGGAAHDAGDAEPSVVPSAAAAGPRGSEAKDKVLHRMQQFKRAGPQKMVHKDKSQPANPTPAPPPAQRRDAPHSVSPGLQPEPRDSDEALALRLQQELDREAAETQAVDLEDRGLFFCQMCHRDLSHMTPEGRTQHLNRCLDESEESAPAPPPPPPGVPDCPICGRKFKSQKSRLAHLKRCSSDMGVAPAVLLQALQRQTEETQNGSTLAQTGGTKRKGPSKPGLPAKKKPRKKAAPLDEGTMVALALSSSLLEQEQRGKRESEADTAASHIATTSLKWRRDTGKGRGKRKRGGVPRPPPLLLVQDAEAALMRLQERVSALLLRSRAPSPPTPTRRPSSLPGWSGAAVLWQKSTLPDGASARPSDFYTPELREFITPWESATTDAAASSTTNKPQPSVQPVSEGTPGTGTMASILPASSQTTPSTSRALLMDLMELAEDGVTLTQCGHAASGPDEDRSTGQIPNMRLSGFVLEEPEEQAELCASGFLPEPTRTPSEDAQPEADEERGSRRSVALSRLASDLSGMVNNPQLSDLQLQVDSGEVYFAHSFMLYARCPLLAEMVHESGFVVREEGEPAAHRVLMNDVPGQAVLALLQYLYTARCSIPAALSAHVLELASRFDLQELQLLCELQQQDPASRGGEGDDMNQEENNRTHQALTELLRSMWDEEDEDDTDAGGGRDEDGELEDDQQAVVLLADREIREENVNEEELEEIYEFAATQRKREEEKDSMEEEEEKVDEEEDGEEVFTKLTEPKRSPSGLSVNKLQPSSQPEPDPGLDRSYSRLFSDSWGVYEEEEPSSLPSTPQCQHRPSPHQPSPGPSVLQSSASVVEDLSLSPPPNASNLPLPGQSPGLEDPALKRESPGPRGMRVPREKEEPELIVLSDSSEEMEVVVSSCGPSPRSPRSVHKLQSYTRINPPPRDATLPNTQSSSSEPSPDDPSAAPVQSPLGPWCDQDPVDCSPEVSWLIPSTPVQPGRSTASSSTQTKSSVFRTQLFPRGDTPSPSVFSSPASATHSPVRVSALYAPKLKPVETRCSGSELNRRSVRPSSGGGASKDGVGGALPPCRPQLSSSTSSKQDTPLQVQVQVQVRPYSSTPLHTELHKVPVLLATSSLHGNLDESWTSRGRDRAPSESPGESFHLSPLSDPTPPPSSSSYRAPQGSQRLGGASRQRHRSVESSSLDSAGSELKGRGLGKDEGEGVIGDEGEQEEADVAESSFQQSFMDEPPMAFNDSWGFDAVDFEANPGRFSLRLEDSGGERSLERRDAAWSSSLQPSPRSHRGSPSKAHGPRASTSGPAHTGVSFTPSPPDPTKQTTPDLINSLLDSKIWDSWEDEEAPPLSQRVNPSAQLQTPASSQTKRRHTVEPITPLPHYSDMDTPELKNKLNRFGVRPLPKRQMILKLKEIHQYTHQLVSSEEEEEEAPVQTKHRTSSEAAGIRPESCSQTVKFKEPRAPAAISISAPNAAREEEEEEEEQLSASQGSTSSSAASGESESRSNPELLPSSDSDSDGGVSASQSANRLQDGLRAVRSFILSDSELYGQILQYRPLVLPRLQERLKAAGIRLSAAKLVDYLDSQCITFTTASSRRGKRPGRGGGRGAKAAGRRRAGTAAI